MSRADSVYGICPTRRRSHPTSSPSPARRVPNRWWLPESGNASRCPDMPTRRFVSDFASVLGFFSTLLDGIEPRRTPLRLVAADGFFAFCDVIVERLADPGLHGRFGVVVECRFPDSRGTLGCRQFATFLPYLVRLPAR